MKRKLEAKLQNKRNANVKHAIQGLYNVESECLIAAISCCLFLSGFGCCRYPSIGSWSNGNRIVTDHVKPFEHVPKMCNLYVYQSLKQGYPQSEDGG